MLVAGEEDVAAAAESDQTLGACAAASELDLDVEALLALHDEHELIALLAPALLARSAKRVSGPVLHLPSTVWVLADLQPIESALASHSVLLAPRVTAELPEDGLEPSPSQLDRAGRMDEAIIGVDGSPSRGASSQWWSDHVEQALGSLDARQSGDRPEDRPWLARFLELAPARFATAVLDDPGCNLSLWNLHRRTLQTGPNRVSVDGRWPLRFLHLPGFEPDHPSRLAANASRARVSRSPALHELCERYARELLDAGWSDIDHHREVGRRLADDLVYDESLRAAYATALALGEPIEDLFDERCTRDSSPGWEVRPPEAGRTASTATSSIGSHGSDPTWCAAIRTWTVPTERSSSPGAGRTAARSSRSPIASCLPRPESERATCWRGPAEGTALRLCLFVNADLRGGRWPQRIARRRSRPGLDDRAALRRRRPGRPAHGLSRPYSRPGGGGPRLRAGAGRRRRAGENRERAAAPSCAAGRTG